MAKSTPVDEFEDYKSKEAAEKAQKDLALWNTWHESGRAPESLQPLMKRYEPLLNNKVREWKAPSVNPAAFKAELQKQFINAAHGFDPNRGVAFNTYLQTRLQKAMRFNTRHQNVGYIPEGQTSHIGKIQVAQNELQESLGRPPTEQEISSHIELPVPQVKRILQNIRKDVPASSFESDPMSFSTGREQDVIRLISRSPNDYLSADETKVFNHIYGSGGARKITSTKDLAQTLGVSQSRISRLKTAIGKKIKDNT
jgi:DNA-directed RNA polymerase specialized sigma subunit